MDLDLEESKPGPVSDWAAALVYLYVFADFVPFNYKARAKRSAP